MYWRKTSINFSINKESKVLITIYDINGNEISHLDYADIYVLSGGTGNADTLAYPMEGIFGDSFWTTGNKQCHDTCDIHLRILLLSS